VVYLYAAGLHRARPRRSLPQRLSLLFRVANGLMSAPKPQLVLVTIPVTALLGCTRAAQQGGTAGRQRRGCRGPHLQPSHLKPNTTKYCTNRSRKEGRGGLKSYLLAETVCRSVLDIISKSRTSSLLQRSFGHHSQRISTTLLRVPSRSPQWRSEASATSWKSLP